MKIKLCILFLCCLLFLTSCWDQRLLSQSKLVYSVGADLEKDGKLLVTAVIQTIAQASKGTSEPVLTNVIVSTLANTFSDSRTKIMKKISGEYATSKARVLLFHEDLAKEDLYPVLDIIYRDPRSSLGAKVVISKDKAADILNLRVVEESLISEEILEIVTTAETSTLVPEENVQSICPTLFDPGEDITLPYLGKSNDKMIDVYGIALFNGRKYTGYNLYDEEPTVLLMMKNEMKKYAKFTLDVNPKEKDERNRFISVQVKSNKVKKKLKINKNNDITAEFDLNIKVAALEYPKDNLADQKEMKRLNKEISKQLTKKAEKLIKTLQLANCDAFGIGRELIAFHPKVWKSLDWEKAYPKITIKPNIKVEIISSGIIE